MSAQIEGVEFKELITHADERGFFREIIRETDPFFDRFERCVKIPPGVAHGCRALEQSHLLYLTSGVYDPDDEGRIPHDDPTIGYDWTALPQIQ